MRRRLSGRGLALLLLVMACDGSDAPVDAASGAQGTADAREGARCNPIMQQGCEDVEKCTFVVDGSHPFGGRTSCVPNGTVPIGEPCKHVAGQNDDCAAPGWCDPEESICREICLGTTEQDSCSEGTCTKVDGAFTDLDHTGICL